MKLPIVTLFAFALFATLVPIGAARTDLCSAVPDACVPPSYFVDGCHVNAGAVRVDLPVDGCATQVYVCSFEYFGGSGTFLGNFVWSCDAVLG